MKKIIFILLIVLFIPIVNALPLPVDVTADSAFVINLDDRVDMYEKNPDKKQILASLTKIMTAYTVIHNVEDLSQTVVITEEDIANLEGFTIIGFEVGEVVTIRDLLYGMMLVSAADAAQALAYHTSGSPASFVELMNKEAKRLDLRNSVFADTFGGSDNNVSTARDMGILLREALKEEEFNKIFKTDYYMMSDNKEAFNSTKNYAIFYGMDSQLITGSKSGYTPEAGLLLTSTVFINEKEYLVIVMKSTENEKLSQHVLDSYKIINYIKEHKYDNRVILKKNVSLNSIKVENSTTDTYVPTVDKEVRAYLNEEEIQKVKYNYNITKVIDNTYKKGDNLGYVDVVIGDDVIYTYDVYLNDNIFEKTSPSSVLVIVLIIFGMAIFVLLFINVLLGKN